MISKSENIKLYVQTVPRQLGQEGLSFMFTRGKEKREPTLSALHFGMLSNEDTVAGWARTFEKLARDLRNTITVD